MNIRLAAIVSACLLASWVIAQDRATPTANDATDQMIRHVVLFKFKAEASDQNIREIEQAFAALGAQIEEVADLEWGVDNSPEGLSQGFTHCFFVTFNSAKDRDAYLPHPAHKRFVELLKPHLDQALVVDYSPQGD